MFTHRVTLFQLHGFRVQVDASWILLAVLIVWSLAVGYFPMAAPGFAPATYWWMAVIGLVGLAASIIIHEFAHSLVARHQNMSIRGITLFVFGGVAEMGEEPANARQELWMALAGPAASVVVAAVFALLRWAAGQGLDHGHPLIVVLGYLAFINLLLAGFNLLPAYPMDGGRVLRAILWLVKKDLAAATRIAATVGSVFAFLLMALGVASLLTGNIIGGLWWFLIGMFMRAAAAGSLRDQMMRTGLSGQPVRRFMRSVVVSVEPSLSIERLVEDYFFRYYFKNFPVVEDGRLIGCVSFDRLVGVDRAQWADRRVGSVMAVCGPESTVEPETDAAAALAMMQRAATGRLFVAQQGRLVGVLTLRDLLHYLALRSELELSARSDGGLLSSGR